MADDADVVYPPLYQSADATSKAQQGRYFLTVKIGLWLLVAVAIVSVLPWGAWLDARGRSIGASAALALLLAALACRIVRGAYRFEEHWFEARALAESIKVESWRYMMKAEPYHVGDEDGAFAERIKTLMASNKTVFGALAEKPVEGLSQITPYMRAARTESLQLRRAKYKDKRLGCQRTWYQDRAASHSKSDKTWTGFGYGFEFLAVIFAVLAALFSWDLGLMGVLTTAAAAFSAWFQSKDFRRLATTYSVVSQDLAVIASKEAKIRTDETFRLVVDEVERTLSREHTFWLDRRLTR